MLPVRKKHPINHYNEQNENRLVQCTCLKTLHAVVTSSLTVCLVRLILEACMLCYSSIYVDFLVALHRTHINEPTIVMCSVSLCGNCGSGQCCQQVLSTILPIAGHSGCQGTVEWST